MEESRVKFLSLAYPEKYGYIFDSKEYRNPGFPAVEAKFRMFNTEGDGMTQHSHDWAITYDFLGDYLGSLTAYLLTRTNFEDEETEQLYRRVSQVVSNGMDNKIIEFARSLTWKERKEKYADEDYYSLDLKKLDRGKNRRERRYDKRWTEVSEWMDGSATAVFRILRREYADGMELLGLAQSIRDYFNDRTDAWAPHVADILAWWKDEGYDTATRKKQILSFGYASVRHAVRSYYENRSAESELGNYTRNYLPKKEVKELVADTDAV